MIIKDRQILLDSMHATVNIKLEYPQNFQYVFMDFLKNSQTRPFFELEKCSFFFKWIRNRLVYLFFGMGRQNKSMDGTFNAI